MKRVVTIALSVVAICLAPALAIAQGEPGGHAGGGPAGAGPGGPSGGGGPGGGARAPEGGGHAGAAGPGGGAAGQGPAMRSQPGMAPAKEGERGGGREGAGRGAPGQEGARGEPGRAGEGAAGKPGTERGNPGEKHGEAGRPGVSGGHGGGPARLSGEQRTHVRSEVRGERIGHPDFAVREGVIIPERYHFLPLPPVLIDIYPEYRGFDYVLVGDEILVLEPGTRRIVAIIEE